MLKNKKRIKFYETIIIAFVLFNFLTVIARAQDITSEALFKRGLARFNQEKYVSARLDFSEIITNHPSSFRVPASYMMLSKTFYNLGAFDSAESTAIKLNRLFPQCPYAEWTRYMISACKFRLGNVDLSTTLLADIVSSSKDTKLKDHALSALKYTVLPVADSDIFWNILKKRNIKPVELDFKKSISSNSVSIPVSYPDPREKLQSGSTIKIGLLTPLTGIYSDYGNDLLSGVKAALSNYTEIDGYPVELLVEDTESDPIQTVLKTRILIAKGVIAIIGPVYGESTVTGAIESYASGIPFLAPTATDLGLTQIGWNVFQFNLTPTVQAKALAELAVKTLGFKNAVVIASNDQWGETILNTFTREMTKSGADIIHTELFDSGVRKVNYHDLLVKIRDYAPDTPVNQDSFIIVNNGSAFPDTIFVKNDFEDETERYPLVETIDCILISAFADDAKIIASQIMEYRIRTVLFGDSGWNGENVLEEGGEYLEGSYLISTVNDSTDVFGSTYFKDDFDKRMVELTSIISRKGYDTCAILIHCLAQGTRDSDTLIKKLESVRDFRGLSSRFTIDTKQHMNIAVDFAKIENGRYVKVNR